MKKKQTVTCRYGVPYEVEFEGTKSAIARSFDLMTRCCCWVCHNHNCKEPHNEIIENCYEVCEIWSKKHYCEN